MDSQTAFEYTIRTRQMNNEVYRVEVQKAPGHWIATIQLPDGTSWNMDRFDPKAPRIPKQWAGATATAAADFAARILTNFFANEGMEIVQKKFLLENGN
jgi:hypothetical protein